MVKNLTFNEGDMGSIPGYGTNIPHVVGNHSHVLQWSTSELQLRSDVAKLKKKKEWKKESGNCNGYIN